MRDPHAASANEALIFHFHFLFFTDLDTKILWLIPSVFILQSYVTLVNSIDCDTRLFRQTESTPAMATSLDKFFTDNDNDYTDYSDTDPDIGDPFPQMAAPWQPRPGLFPPDYDNQRAPAAYSYGPESTLQQTKQIAQKNRQGQYPKPQPQPQTGNASSPSEGLTILSKGTSQSLMGGMQK